jgi:hypothetical protein
MHQTTPTLKEISPFHEKFGIERHGAYEIFRFCRDIDIEISMGRCTNNPFN